MEWMMSNSQIHNTFAALGVKNGDSFNVSNDCLRVLEEILQKLSTEDQTLRTFRRAICFGQNISNDLIPLLIFVKHDANICDAIKIIDTTIKILVNLTIPIECLLPLEAMSHSDIGRHTIFELNRLLITSKQAFSDSRSTKAVVDHIKYMLDTDAELNVQQCDSINNCLLLFINILHIPEIRVQSTSCSVNHPSMQNIIIWNLFTQSIDKIIINLLSCPQKAYCGVTMVQLISLMYKDQHAGALQKLLNLWLEASLSESSDDNESNTSTPDKANGDCSPNITSDPTSDSSDNGGGDSNKDSSSPDNMRNKTSTTEVVRAAQNRSKALAGMKRHKSIETETSSSSGVFSITHSMDSTVSKVSNRLTFQHSGNPKSLEKIDALQPQKSTSSTQMMKGVQSQSEISDCGYVTQVENQESVSTSSNDDDQPQKPHQKPPSFQKTRYNNQKNRSTTALKNKELRRKKLVKRSKTNILNMKGLMHHTPTDDDISNILKEFTVDFLLKGYGHLVNDLYLRLLSNIHVPIDTSHFFWLVTYFLKFATQLELDLEHIHLILTHNIFSYLIFQGVWLYEEMEISMNIPGIDLKPCLRRLHLVITAIREFVQAVEMYPTLSHISDEDKTTLHNLQKQMIQMEDLKQLLVLLLRQYNPNLQSKQYLQDLIVTNHNYLLFLDNVSKRNNSPSNIIVEHLKEFATVEIMKQYGLQLENFKENGEFVNNCVFTMMHHIGGDLKNISTLFQPSILKTFSQIWETDYKICDDWSDLIEYVIHKFINTPGTNRFSGIAPPISQEHEIKLAKVDSPKNRHLKEENEDLDKYRSQYKNFGRSNKTQAIITELLHQNIIPSDKNDEVKRKEQINEQHFENEAIPQVITKETLINGDISVLREFLCQENKGGYLTWLQKFVIEACFVKVIMENSEQLKDLTPIMEPSVYYYSLLHLPVPVVPWTTEQCNSLKYQPFILLLHKLGFYLPADTGKIFVRIPNFWTADYLFSIAQQLGPIDSSKLKFDANLFDSQDNSQTLNEKNNIPNSSSTCKFSIAKTRQTPATVRYTPLPNSAKWVETILNKDVSITDYNSNQGNHLLTTKLDIHLLKKYKSPKINITGHPITLPMDEHMAVSVDMDISTTEDESLEVMSVNLEHNSTCETESVASDLTRMCVSDEEDKLIFTKLKEVS